MAFSSSGGKRALEYLKRMTEYESGMEVGMGSSNPYCPHRAMFRAGMREVILIIEAGIKTGLQQIDERSSE